MDFKLGKLPAIYDSRTLRLENYLNIPKLPPLPDTSDWFAMTTQFPMLANDQYGDCVVAGAAHMIQTWSANSANECFITERKVVDTYLNLTGGVDSGLNMLEFLKYWRQTGIDGHKIGAFAAIDPKNLTSWRYANYLFGGVFSGFALYESATTQFNGNKAWDVVKKPGLFLGGHCVNGGIVTPHLLSFGTWGKKQWATVNFVGQYCDEAYAIISLDWFTADHQTPHGFHWKDLLADLKAITG